MNLCSSVFCRPHVMSFQRYIAHLLCGEVVTKCTFTLEELLEIPPLFCEFASQDVRTIIVRSSPFFGTFLVPTSWSVLSRLAGSLLIIVCCIFAELCCSEDVKLIKVLSDIYLLLWVILSFSDIKFCQLSLSTRTSLF